MCDDLEESSLVPCFLLNVLLNYTCKNLNLSSNFESLSRTQFLLKHDHGNDTDEPKRDKRTIVKTDTNPESNESDRSPKRKIYGQYTMVVCSEPDPVSE